MIGTNMEQTIRTKVSAAENKISKNTIFDIKVNISCKDLLTNLISSDITSVFNICKASMNFV